VKIIAPRHPASSELCIMGVVEGTEDLLNLLETVAVDNVLVCSEEIPFRPTVTAYERSPRNVSEI
jgi:hypothetical protein